MHIFVADGDPLETQNQNVMSSGALEINSCVNVITMIVAREILLYNPITAPRRSLEYQSRTPEHSDSPSMRLCYFGPFKHILSAEKRIRDIRTNI